MNANLFSDQDRRFLDAITVARLATADADGVPHVLPICFLVIGETLYFTIDQKPKSGDARRLKRLRNLHENPNAAVVIDRYDHDDWSRLGWIMVDGPSEILVDGPEHALAQAGLKRRYRQYRDMEIEALPVVSIRITRVRRWGNLEV